MPSTYSQHRRVDAATLKSDGLLMRRHDLLDEMCCHVGIPLARPSPAPCPPTGDATAAPRGCSPGVSRVCRPGGQRSAAATGHRAVVPPQALPPSRDTGAAAVQEGCVPPARSGGGSGPLACFLLAHARVALQCVALARRGFAPGAVAVAPPHTAWLRHVSAPQLTPPCALSEH